MIESQKGCVLTKLLCSWSAPMHWNLIYGNIEHVFQKVFSDNIIKIRVVLEEAFDAYFFTLIDLRSLLYHEFVFQELCVDRTSLLFIITYKWREVFPFVPAQTSAGLENVAAWQYNCKPTEANHDTISF